MQLGPVDVQLHMKETQAIKRKEKYLKFAENERTSTLLSSKVNVDELLEISSDEDDDDDALQEDTDPSYEATLYYDEDDDMVHLSLPRKTLLSETAEVATRCGISHRQQIALTSKLIKVGGGELADTSMSVSTSYRQRKQATQKISDEIKEDFSKHIPKYLIVHWDSKVIKYAHHHETDDRLAIIVSQPGIPPQADQFLAAPCIPDSTGQTMADALNTTLQDWQIPNGAIIGTCWDTTASNTGCHEGAATHFEQHTLSRACLWLACRHHVGELHIKHADTAARGPTRGPTDTMFERFRTAYPGMQRNNLVYVLWEEADNITRPFTWLKNEAERVLAWGRQHLLIGTFPREDYRELLELAVHYLGGQVIRPRANGPPQVGFNMRQPGALHHARFMAKGIYIMKIAMLVDELPHNFLTRHQREGVRRMAVFIAIFYTPYFLTARLPACAPREDLTLWRNMCQFRTHDRQIGDAVKTSIKRHQWYLSEQLVVFCLFDPDLSDNDKAAVGAALLACQQPNPFPTGKPQFPNNRLFRGAPTLASFVGPNSYLVFHLLGMDHGWLALPPPAWLADQRYQEMADVINSISVVNDTAERCVKNVQDFANAARDGAHRGRIILVANSHRVKIPTFTKNEMEENI